MFEKLKKNYFTNKSYGFLYLHSIFKSAAFLTVFLFVGGWLYEIGIALHWIIAYHMANFTLMGLFSPVSAVLTRAIGLKLTYGISYIFFVLSLICLSFASNDHSFIVLGLLCGAIGNGIQNPLDMIFQALYVENHNRGKTISFIHAMGALSSAVVVIVSGWLIEQYGFWGVTVLCSFFWAICFMFLHFMKKPEEQLTSRPFNRHYPSVFMPENRKYIWIAAGFQFIVIGSAVLVPIVMYLATNNFQSMSYIAAMAIVAQSVILLLQGAWVDKKSRSNHPLATALGVNLVGLLVYAFFSKIKYAVFIGDAMQRTGFLMFMGSIFPRIHNDILSRKLVPLDFGVMFHMQICFWEFITLGLVAFMVFSFGQIALSYCLVICGIGSFICYFKCKKLQE